MSSMQPAVLLPASASASAASASAVVVPLRVRAAATALAAAFTSVFGTPQRRAAVLGLLAASAAMVGTTAAAARRGRSEHAAATDPAAPQKKPWHVGRTRFQRQLLVLLRIVVPSLRSKEALLVALHTAFLAFRTLLSVLVAYVDGWMVRSIVERNPRQFIRNIATWLLLGIPASYTNAMLRYLEGKLAIAFRTRLTEHAYAAYMGDETYYRVTNLDTRLLNPDQCLTEDIARFSQALAHLYSQLTKPVLDLVVNTTELLLLSRRKTQTAGFWSTALAFVTVYSTSALLRAIRPHFGALAVAQARLEGRLRSVHARLIANSEEVAFYGGARRELGALSARYSALVRHLNRALKTRIFYNVIESFLMKYVWSSAGLAMIAIPAFIREFHLTDAPGEDTHTISTRAGDYTFSKKLLVDAADAVERLLLATKEINELSGYTRRVAEMFAVFSDAAAGRFLSAEGVQRLASRGRVLVDPERICFDAVPIVSPTGEVLVPALTFAIRAGEHLLVTGPNGCGKSSMFRILGGVWPPTGGTLTCPPRERLFYVPQKPYLPVGSFREQITYPDSAEAAAARGWPDERLEAVLDWSELRAVWRREGGWDAVREWTEVLSGGEKQRVGLARVFYHRPCFAILDECTSAVSIDVEGSMFLKAKELGITLLTVSHRPSLWRFHDHLLQFNGEGGYTFGPLNAQVRLSLMEEKEKLEAQLVNVPKMQKRLGELCRLLGDDRRVLAVEEKGDDEKAKEREREGEGAAAASV